MLENLILGVLALRPMSGYDLGKWMDGPGRFIGYRVTLPQIYRTFSRLTERALVTFDVDPRAGKPDAKLYRLTETGRRALLEWARSPYEPAPRPMDPDFTLRFVFTGMIDPGLALDVLRTELDYRRTQIRTPTAIDELSGGIDPIADIDRSWAAHILRTAHDRGRASTAAYIGWLEMTIAEFENRHDAAPTSMPPTSAW